MPEISRFYGIVIKMYFREHNPPHFHAEYQDYEALINIKNGDVTGKMPRRALRLIYDWLDKYQVELLDNWELGQQNKKFNNINPLD